MKTPTLLLVAAMMLGTAAPALAQESPPAAVAHAHGHGRGAHRLEMLSAILGLDAHQQDLIRQAFAQSAPERERIRAMTPGSEEQRAAHVALRERMHQQIDAVLTPDQRATLARMRATREAHGGPRGMRHGRGGPGRGGPGHGAPPSAGI